MKFPQRVALVHDYWVTLRGGERVFLALQRLFPEADCYALISRAGVLPPGSEPLAIRSSLLRYVPFGARHYRALLPLYPLAAAALDLSAYDLVISSSSGFSHGVRTSGVHIAYCHTPLRYAWHEYRATVSRMSSPLTRALYGAVMGYVRQLDYEAAQRVTSYVANSAAVQERIASYYGRRSTIVHPFVDTRRFQPAAPGTAPDDYFLVVSQLNAYKRVDLAIDACNRLGRRLVIVGNGPERARLERLAGPTISFLSRVGEDDLPGLYANCAGFLQCGDEDFGIAALEAQASGRPVIAYGASGALETVAHGRTGLHFASAFVDASPALLGLDGPSHFLLFDLDSDELRPTGGFLGNYAPLTFSGGMLTSGIHLHDVYTLDCPHVCAPRPFPQADAWFPLSVGYYGLRDANLDPNLPTSAWQMEHLYQQESGTQVNGIVTITPAVIADLLRVIGPVQVPVFNVTVTADNLQNLLHYYHQNAQIAEGLGISPQQYGTSVFKVFDVLLSRAVFGKLGAMGTGAMGALGKTLMQALATKDIQVFFNDPRLEADLARAGFAGELPSGPGDALSVVDTNDGGSYANADVQERLTDAVTLDASGGAEHSLDIAYTYPVVKHTYDANAPYGDLVRVIVPAGAARTSIQGPCTPMTAPEAGHVVLACQLTLQRGAGLTLHFRWYVPPTGKSHATSYTLLLQRQPGAHVTAQITITPAPHETISAVSAPAALQSGQLRWSGQVLTDTTFAASLGQEP